MALSYRHLVQWLFSNDEEFADTLIPLADTLPGLPQVQAALDPQQARVSDAEAEDKAGRGRAPEAGGGQLHHRELHVLARVEAHLQPGEAAFHHRPRHSARRAQVRSRCLKLMIRLCIHQRVEICNDAT